MEVSLWNPPSDTHDGLAQRFALVWHALKHEECPSQSLLLPVLKQQIPINQDIQDHKAIILHILKQQCPILPSVIIVELQDRGAEE
jgi:hypothetical protein